MTVVTITRKVVKDDYFKRSLQGFTAEAGSAVPTNTMPFFERAKVNKTTLVQGENNIVFDTAFPNGTEYIVWSYTYDANNYQVGSYIIQESDGRDGVETGFTIYVAKACTLKYIAIPINV